MNRNKNKQAYHQSTLHLFSRETSSKFCSFLLNLQSLLKQPTICNSERQFAAAPDITGLTETLSLIWRILLRCDRESGDGAPSSLWLNEHGPAPPLSAPERLQRGRATFIHSGWCWHTSDTQTHTLVSLVTTRSLHTMFMGLQDV